MPANSHPRLDIARAALRNLVDESVAVGKPVLPPIRAMAASAGVSALTMQHAVAELCRSGVLRTNHRHGTSILSLAADKPAQPTRSRRVPRWRRIAQQIESDLARGAYAPGKDLPPAKTLARHYGVCFRTLRRSIDFLEELGTVERRFRAVAVPARGVPSAASRIVLVAAGGTEGALGAATPRSQEFFRAIENECTQANVNLRNLSYRSWDDVLVGPNGEHLPSIKAMDEFDRVLGFVFCTVAMPRPTHYQAMVQRLLDTDRPVAVLDESSEIDFRSLSNKRHLSVFAMGASPQGGRQVGEYLFRRGHRGVAFLSPFGDLVWSRNRLAGLQHVYELHGLPGAVHAVVSRGFRYGEDLTNKAEEVFRRRYAVLFGRPAGASDMAAQAVAAAQSEIRAMLSGVLTREVARLSLLPLMEQALTYDQASAWVGANDEIALQCREFLQSRGRRVPQQVSVVGFDDSLDAFLSELSSYNFNCQAVARAMVGRILSPEGSERRAYSVEEIPGFINERRTSEHMVSQSVRQRLQ